MASARRLKTSRARPSLPSATVSVKLTTSKTTTEKASCSLTAAGSSRRLSWSLSGKPVTRSVAAARPRACSISRLAVASKASRPCSVTQSEAWISLTKKAATSSPGMPAKSTPSSTEFHTHRRRTEKSSITPTASRPRSCCPSAIRATRDRISPPRLKLSTPRGLSRNPAKTSINSSIMPAMRSEDSSPRSPGAPPSRTRGCWAGLAEYARLSAVVSPCGPVYPRGIPAGRCGRARKPATEETFFVRQTYRGWRTKHGEDGGLEMVPTR
jgi:hypothetical protein